MCSPFLGGASVELACARASIKIFGYDVFAPLIDFWQEAIVNARDLADYVEKTHFANFSRDHFLPVARNSGDIAAPKTTRRRVFRAEPRLIFRHDFVRRNVARDASLHRLGDRPFARFAGCEIFRLNASISPTRSPAIRVISCISIRPYMIEQALYGKKGNTHKNFDHFGLADILRARGNWILSYNDSANTRDLYRGYATRPLLWAYGMSKHKKCREILILSHDIADYFGQSV